MGGIGVMRISPVQLSPTQKKACASKEMMTERAKNCCLGRQGVAFIYFTQGTGCQSCCKSSEPEYVTIAKCMGLSLCPFRIPFPPDQDVPFCAF